MPTHWSGSVDPRLLCRARSAQGSQQKGCNLKSSLVSDCRTIEINEEAHEIDMATGCQEDASRSIAVGTEVGRFLVDQTILL